jgi:hypothetical protein
MKDDEFVVFGELEPTDVGVIVEVKCPSRELFVERSTGRKRFTVDPDGGL